MSYSSRLVAASWAGMYIMEGISRRSLYNEKYKYISIGRHNSSGSMVCVYVVAYALHRRFGGEAIGPVKRKSRQSMAADCGQYFMSGMRACCICRS